MEKIEFEDYDRISDCLMWINDNITLNFIVSLAKKNKLGERKFFHYETIYGVDKYTQHPSRSIKRNMDFYFVFDNRNSFANGLVLRPQDVEVLIMFINRSVLPWFYGSKKEQAFKIVNNELALAEYNPVTWAQSADKYITFEPIIFRYEDGTSGQFIRLTFYSGDVADLSIDKFMGLYSLLKCDMYAVACTNAAYTRMEPHGINIYNSQGLGGGPRKEQEMNNDWNNSNNKGYKGYNSFLDNAKSKK